MSLNSQQLRQKFLDYQQKNNHTVVPSRSLVPENDPTTLFTTAGMQWMLPYLLGQESPMGTRVANSQKCLRADDIDEIGDNRHSTFFEMLGNWSFGDYFRKEQLTWVFHFLVDEVGLDPKRLYVTAFRGSEEYDIPQDTEAIKIWQKLFAEYDIDAQVVENPAEQGMVENGRIFLYTWENWWSRAGKPDNMPVGEPGGPDSEIFYDYGAERKDHQQSEFKDQVCHLNCDCGRFLEIGNSVFMQFKKTAAGFEPLAKKNIDFGGGLERVLAAAHDEQDIFKTDLFWPVIEKIQEQTQTQYQEKTATHFRIITDHVKAAVMLITDGVEPGNKDRSYLVRRFLRRAIRHGKKIGAQPGLLSSLVSPVIEIYKDHYPELAKKKDFIQQTIDQESERFEQTIEKGLKEFAKATAKTKKLTGELAFTLYQTYGFPLEMSIEEAKEQKVKIAKDLQQEFEQAEKKHIAKSRSGAAQKFSGGLANKGEVTTQYHTATHLINAALRQVLGSEAEQRGSNITDKRLRFDFAYGEALTDKQIQQVEDLVNEWIKQDLPVKKELMEKQAALDSGAVAVFVERYPDQVFVYSICDGDHEISKELCGGPHVDATGEIGQIEIFKEKSAGAGVRRVYARKVK